MIKEDYKFQEGDQVRVSGKVYGQGKTGIVKSVHGPHDSFIVVDHGNGDSGSYHDTDLSHHEEMEESILLELSKKVLASYVKKAGEDQIDTFASKSFRSGKAGDKYNKADDDKYTEKRSKGIDRALGKLMKESLSYSEFCESIDLHEKLGPDASVGDYIADFEKLDAPQFKGKSKAKRRQMAIAASYALKESVVHLNDGRDYGDQPSEKSRAHVELGLKKFGGAYQGSTDKGVLFKFSSRQNAQNFADHVRKGCSDCFADLL